MNPRCLHPYLPLLAIAAACGLAGCMIGGPSNPAATRPVTEVDPATTQPYYWLDQPATATVVAGDYDKLWETCKTVMEDVHFRVDRQDYRNGVLTSEPTVSKQYYEVWRSDGPTVRDTAESSLAGIRRTIVCQFTRDQAQNTFTVAPKVLVERRTIVESKLRATLDYDPIYWYPVRRDAQMEQQLADRVQAALAHH